VRTNKSMEALIGTIFMYFENKVQTALRSTQIVLTDLPLSAIISVFKRL
jgi:hypothetical protein